MRWLVLFLLICNIADAKTVCLNMIVKDEHKVIERCLNSVKNHIDYWVIVDTGSTDGTQELIRSTLKDVPGELHEKPWVNFGFNRNQALQLAKAKGDYLLFIDADEQLLISDQWDPMHLDQDAYLAFFIDPADQMRFERILLINNRQDWHWEGVVHEKLVNPQATKIAFIEGASCQIDTMSSNRSQDPQKYIKDAKLLEESLRHHPDDANAVFYLAQSYANAKEYQLSLDNYAKRANMPGRDTETFWSLFAVARLQEALEYPPETIIHSYCKAYHYRPSRAEPLVYLGDYFLKTNNPLLAYLLAKQATTLSTPNDLGYIDNWVYDYGIPLLLATSSFHLGKYEEARPLYHELLSNTHVPQARLSHIRQQLAICIEKKLKG